MFCPYCQLPLDAPDLAGQQVACPRCQNVFVMPGITPMPQPTTVGRYKSKKRSAWPVYLMIGLGIGFACVLLLLTLASSNRSLPPIDGCTVYDVREGTKQVTVQVLVDHRPSVNELRGWSIAYANRYKKPGKYFWVNFHVGSQDADGLAAHTDDFSGVLSLDVDQPDLLNPADSLNP